MDEKGNLESYQDAWFTLYEKQHPRKPYTAAVHPADFKVGDVITRSGDDRQRVLSIAHEWGIMEVQCIKAPASGWCKVGENESNLISRYSFVERPAREPKK